MVLGSVPIAVFEALRIVVATWFLEVCFASRSWKYTYRCGQGFWKFTYRRLGSLPTIGPAWFLEAHVASARLVLVLPGPTEISVSALFDAICRDFVFVADFMSAFDARFHCRS